MENQHFMRNYLVEFYKRGKILMCTCCLLYTSLIYQGYHSDAARTYAVGEVSPEARQLMEVTKQSFFEGIKFAKAGNHLNDISKAIGAYAAKYNLSLIHILRIGIPDGMQKQTSQIIWLKTTISEHF